jgi:hypothetical protein
MSSRPFLVRAPKPRICIYADDDPDKKAIGYIYSMSTGAQIYVWIGINDMPVYSEARFAHLNHEQYREEFLPRSQLTLGMRLTTQEQARLRKHVQPTYESSLQTLGLA